ncbi:hypothetical protein NE237_017631 [Protea cynaroides]|uniref:Uncharacterized protein n=1 Tax=Protea cynaroides TaxID=273540 RepID=A0A9Q0K8F2_9MAGN|nr:hypothetical protein NE237_017631 [Protea cynaroides]
MIGKVLVKNPFIMGLTELDFRRLAMNFPGVLGRDRFVFVDEQVVVLVTGYRPILIKSIRKSLEPRIRFLVEVMRRGIDDHEVVDYPNFFQHGLKRRLELRQNF